MMGSSREADRRGTSTAVTRLTAFAFPPMGVAGMPLTASRTQAPHVTVYSYDPPPARFCPELLPSGARNDTADPDSAAADLPHPLPKRGASGMHEGAGKPGDEAANGHGSEAVHDYRAKLGFSLARQPVHSRQRERCGCLPSWGKRQNSIQSRVHDAIGADRLPAQP